MKSIDRIKVLLLFLSVTAGIVAALILLSLLSPSPAGATGLAQGGPATCLITDTLENLVGCIYDYMPRRYGIDGRNGFTAPTTTEMSQWRDVVGRMIRGECNINLSKVYTGDWVNDFTVTTFTDTQASRTYCVFMETGYNYYSSKERVKRGWGTFIVNQHPSRELSIQVPHPISDIGTAMEGVGIFKGTNSRSFLMAGTHPDANNITSTCQSTYPQADVAHNTRSMFQPTVERLLEFYDSTGGDFVAVQFHGMATSSCPGVDGYMTHGISTAPVLGNKILELKANLLRHNPTWTVTVPGDSPTCYLAVTTSRAGC